MCEILVSIMIQTIEFIVFDQKQDVYDCVD